MYAYSGTSNKVTLWRRDSLSTMDTFLDTKLVVVAFFSLWKRTTSLQRTKSLLPMCPLFRGATVQSYTEHLYMCGSVGFSSQVCTMDWYSVVTCFLTFWWLEWPFLSHYILIFLFVQFLCKCLVLASKQCQNNYTYSMHGRCNTISWLFCRRRWIDNSLKVK